MTGVDLSRRRRVVDEAVRLLWLLLSLELVLLLLLLRRAKAAAHALRCSSPRSGCRRTRAPIIRYTAHSIRRVGPGRRWVPRGRCRRCRDARVREGLGVMHEGATAVVGRKIGHLHMVRMHLWLQLRLVDARAAAACAEDTAVRVRGRHHARCGGIADGRRLWRVRRVESRVHERLRIDWLWLDEHWTWTGLLVEGSTVRGGICHPGHG